MHSSESVLPAHFFSPIQAAPRSARPELILLARVAEDVIHWLDCNWVVGMVRIGRDLQVACVMGARPDLEACLEFVCGVMGRSARPAPLSVAEGSPGLPAIVAPIGNSPGVEPILAIGPPKRSGRYSARDLEMVQDLCASTGVLLGNARLSEAVSAEVAETDRIRNDFETAQELQERFLPAASEHVSGLDYHGRSLRCGRLGGDFFGFLRPNHAELLMMLGNVAPAGAAAALLAAGLQATLRARLENERDLRRILLEVNRLMWEVSPGDVFGSLFCARIDPEQRRLEYVSAGPCTAVVARRQANRVDRLESANAILGLSLASVYVKHVIVFEPGDVLVALGEGIADALSGGSRSFAGAFSRMLGSLVDTSARDVAGRILDAVEQPSGKAADATDRTVTIIRSMGQARGVSMTAAAA